MTILSKKSIRDNRGFTLVEMMMTLLIFGVVMGVIGNVFFTTQGLYGRTSERATQQMSARAGLSIIAEELRRAGYDPDGAGIVGLESAHADTIRVNAELNDVDGLQTGEPSETVTYYFDQDLEAVMRNPGTGAQVMVEDVTAFTMTYYDAANQVVGPPPLTPTLAGTVRSVEVLITTETPRGGEVSYTTRIGFRNF